MSGLTDKMRTEMRAINAGISHTRRGPATAKYLHSVKGELVWEEDSAPVREGNLFPFPSVQMATEPEDVPAVKERLRKGAEGPAKYTEFDREGRPIITSTKQHDDLAKTLEMKTGRDGFGHTDEFGNFQTSGRQRNDEIQEGRGRVRRAIKELKSMPEEVPEHVVSGVLDQYDIRPTEENTG